MEKNESMLKNYVTDNTPKILIYIEGTSNDGDRIGKLVEKEITQEMLDYLRAIFYIYNECFNKRHWERTNPFAKYRIGDYDDGDDYDDDDYDDEYDEDDDDHHFTEGKKVKSKEIPIEKMKLELIYNFMDKYLPYNGDEKCHSVSDFDIYIISSQNSGRLVLSDISDEEIARIWEARKR